MLTIAQMTGFRMIADELYGAPSNANLCAVRTAAEMAVVPHSLSPMGQLAKEPNGNCWGWSDSRQLWFLYEVAESIEPEVVPEECRTSMLCPNCGSEKDITGGEGRVLFLDCGCHVYAKGVCSSFGEHRNK